MSELRTEIGENRSTELGRMGMAPYFTPGFVRTSSSESKTRPVQRNIMKNTMGIGSSGPSSGPKVISLTLQVDVQSSKADNSRKPTLATLKDQLLDHSLTTEVC